MAKNTQTLKQWKDLQPADGYFAALNLSGEVRASLVFGLYAAGSMKTIILASCEWPTARIIGDLKRKLIFWQGYAEYLNAGGDGQDLIENFKEVTEQFQGKLVFEGWSYFDTGINTNGNRVHEFISDSPEDFAPMRFVRWVRNEFVDYRLTEQDMLESDNYVRPNVPSTQAFNINLTSGEDERRPVPEDI